MVKKKFFVIINYDSLEEIYRSDELTLPVNTYIKDNKRKPSTIWSTVNETEAAMLYVYAQFAFDYQPAVQRHYAVSIAPFEEDSERQIIDKMKEMGSKRKLKFTGKESNLTTPRADTKLQSIRRGIVEYFTRKVKERRRKKALKDPFVLTTLQEELDAKQLPRLSEIATYIATDGLNMPSNKIAVTGYVIQHKTGMIEQNANLIQETNLSTSEVETNAIIDALKRIPKSQYNQPVVVMTDNLYIANEWDNFVLLDKYLQDELTGALRELMEVANNFTKLRFVKVASHKHPANRFVHKKINRLKDEYIHRLTN